MVRPRGTACVFFLFFLWPVRPVLRTEGAGECLLRLLKSRTERLCDGVSVLSRGRWGDSAWGRGRDPAR